MKFNYFFCALCFSALVFSSCNQQAEEQPAEEEVDELAGTPFTRETPNENCLFIVHDVKDYGYWKATFDLAESIRKKKGLSTLDVYMDRTNPNRALVLTSVENLQEAKTYITSEELQQSMENAGVVSELELYWLQNMLTFTKEITDTIPMFMTFNVVSYERWENVFLSDIKENPNYDFQVLNVYRGVANANQISMLFAVSDPDYFEKKEKDNAFLMKMLGSGVISYPVTYKLKAMPI